MTPALKDRKFLILVAAFAAVYLFWGSTYLAIKYSIETLPPFLMAGVRFLIAGSILFGVSLLSKDRERPTLRHWKTSAVVGTLLLLGGNGGVVLAQQYISSGLAALLVATEPLWIVVLSWVWLRSGRPNWRVGVGLLIGFVGVWLLIGGKGSPAAGGADGQLFGALAVMAGALFWATGSIYGLKAPTPRSSLMTAGMQMIAGSVSLLVVGTVRGEAAAFDPAAVSSASLFGLLYLIVFGSLIGYTAYSWLLKNARPTMVSTYAYINPVVAVFLGWAIAGESLTGQMLVGAMIIVASVVLVTSRKGQKERESKGPIVPRGDPELSTCG